VHGNCAVTFFPFAITEPLSMENMRIRKPIWPTLNHKDQR
jgi:hypothetical protein